MKIVFEIIVLLFLSILVIGCGKTEIKLLCKDENVDGISDEVYLIKNHPKDENDLIELMNYFNKDLNETKKSVSRTFLKEHDNSWLNFPFGDKINYESTKCEDIDNMDIICIISKINFLNGGDTIVFNYLK